MLDHQKERKHKNMSVVLGSLSKLPVAAILVVWSRRSIKQTVHLWSSAHQYEDLTSATFLLNSDSTLRFTLTLVNSYYVESKVGPKNSVQSEAKSEATDTKMIFFIFMQMKLIFARNVLHLASF